MAVAWTGHRFLRIQKIINNILLSVCYHFVFAWLFMSISYTKTGLQICSGTSTRQLLQMENYGKKRIILTLFDNC